MGLLPEPEVGDCYFDGGFSPSLAAMHLRWPEGRPAERVWTLPDGTSFPGPLPERFGIRIHRWADDCYRVQLLWDRRACSWEAVGREQMLASSLQPLLAAMGASLAYFLDQPVCPGAAAAG